MCVAPLRTAIEVSKIVLLKLRLSSWLSGLVGSAKKLYLVILAGERVVMLERVRLSEKGEVDEDITARMAGGVLAHSEGVFKCKGNGVVDYSQAIQDTLAKLGSWNVSAITVNITVVSK